MDEVGREFEVTMMSGGGVDELFGTNDSVVTFEFSSGRDCDRLLAA